MKNTDLFEQAILRMQERAASPEYQKAVEHFRGEMTRMEQVAVELEAKFSAIRSLAEEETVRTEYASGSDLHRGYYCPSPVFDFVVGNTHRGKLLKRVTKASKPSHEYGFSSDGRLLWCRWLQDGTVTMTEYLVRDADRVLGIMLDAHGNLNTVTEEIFQEEKLQCYLCGSFWLRNGKCHELTAEYYTYDENGLLSSQLHQLTLPPQNIPHSMRKYIMAQPIYQGEKYLFERTDGFLSGYQCQGRFYAGCTKRSALPGAQINGINLMDIKE